MAKSFRLGPGLKARLERVARAEGTSTSESIRRAIGRYCEQVLGAALAPRLTDVIGIGRGGGGRARRSGEAFRRVLRRNRRQPA
ncbi:MAG: ribbon-helix-helix protein, CopG family [Bacillati bacterium ANGP1]|uniref:Ribbon-helix-helix protein, CopG family n=1 Tax=Candidatus Segetimicrobium genomatis TaxID=2569760 RepID=A0A537JGF7_9BACT|nr:MAG: ribbon-helix-helix protein, CopG family [Terrabacteria group bacterium ANGP1]